VASSRFLHALLTVGLLAVSQATQAQWSAANDEANRQRMMASMRAQDAANDRAAADRAFQAGLEQQRSLGSGSSPSSSSSGSGGMGTPLDGLAAALGRGNQSSGGPQSVVDRRTYIIHQQETSKQVVARLFAEAEGGNPESAWNLGRLYYTGYAGVPRDDAQARRWFATAGERGHAEALANLGYFAHEGIGGPQDPALALDATARAAAAGSTYGAGLNGIYRLSGLADGQLDPVAVANLERAADAGELFAQAALGTIVYELGVGTAENWERAAHYARLAADQGHGPSMTELARMMFVGRGVAQDQRGAVAMFRRAAEAGDPAGMSFLGQLYMTGQGVANDVKAGMELFRRAADLGHPEAQGVYGLSLMLGQGVAENVPEGLRYIRLGAAQNDPQALTVLGKMTFVGEGGITSDERRGVELLQAAAALGYQDAIETLAMDEVQQAMRRLGIAQTVAPASGPRVDMGSKPKR
jgi:TPR repeat protein